MDRASEAFRTVARLQKRMQIINRQPSVSKYLTTRVGLPLRSGPSDLLARRFQGSSVRVGAETSFILCILHVLRCDSR